MNLVAHSETGPRPSEPKSQRRGWRRALLWASLVALLVVAQSLLVMLTLSYEDARAQEQVEQLAAEIVSHTTQIAGRDLQSLQALLWQSPQDPRWQADAAALLRRESSLLRIEYRDADRHVRYSVDTPFGSPLFRVIGREQLQLETELACAAALRHGAHQHSRSYFVPTSEGEGVEIVDLCLPLVRTGEPTAYLVASVGLHVLLDEAGAGTLNHNEISFVEGDGTRLARAGLVRGAGVYRAERVVDLPGLTLQLRVDSANGRPSVIPNFTTALVLVLSLALFAVVLLLARDVRRRASAERALADALAFRQAMENSLSTGLRARDLEGNITYVNAAFCAMVGFESEQLLGHSSPPYWPPEHVEDYVQRQLARRERWESDRRAGGQEARQGFETVFVRRNGERFPVLIFEAPLRDAAGEQTGWMSAVLDVSEQKRVEELSRQQQERLQATARLATVGEMASLLSHELNQPLAAIASYATASLNLMDREADDPLTPGLVRQAVQRVADQAERAGRVIKSVHDFVRRRDQAREAIAVGELFEAVLPLARLQARKSGTRIEIETEPYLRVRCDRTMVEQVLLNLSRNGIQSMEAGTPLSARVLRLCARSVPDGRVELAVIDQGPGMAPEVVERLFTPFFTTRSEGMGLGLSLCRTVAEQHGGQLEFDNPQETGHTGATFRFTLPVESPAMSR